jgi:hypothetical protein
MESEGPYPWQFRVKIDQRSGEGQTVYSDGENISTGGRMVMRNSTYYKKRKKVHCRTEQRRLGDLLVAAVAELCREESVAAEKKYEKRERSEEAESTHKNALSAGNTATLITPMEMRNAVLDPMWERERHPCTRVRPFEKNVVMASPASFPTSFPTLFPACVFQ